jgi:hypothetical protein
VDLLLVAHVAEDTGSIAGFDPATLDALSRLGAFGISMFLIGLLLARKIITMGEKKDSDAEKDARMAELRSERDEWKKMALESSDSVKRLVTGLEAQNEAYERRRPLGS